MKARLPFKRIYSLPWMVKGSLLFLLVFSCTKEAKPDPDHEPYDIDRIAVNHPEPNPKKLKEGKAYLFFSEFIFPSIRKNECGDCKDLCHHDKHDRGGLTCVGISITHNSDFYVKELNSFDKTCEVNFRGTISCDRRLFYTQAKRRHFNKYVRPFSACGRKALLLIADSSVLSGQSVATRLIQRAGGLKEDGKLGKNTIKACQDDTFKGKAFTKKRIERFKRLKQCPRYCKGWISRANKMLEKYTNI